ncbi:hypothetical protein G6F18_012982 [Rhizopus arrhizus]|nr:hypothetical protein G6F19_012963 [Rhizopus arrhizus]KAG0816627.1 hypothetical protein G6F18_012982 [Rhizopus arrhizus]KAG0907297.1 hypothetical protein G6F33_010697 [Rhizopus arrhizus]
MWSASLSIPVSNLSSVLSCTNTKSLVARLCLPLKILQYNCFPKTSGLLFLPASNKATVNSELPRSFHTIRDDFDPLSPSIIRDPTLLNESIERKTKLARHVFLQRLGSAFRRLKAPLYNAVTNYFLQSGLIDLNFLESFDLAPPHNYHNPLLDKI